MNNNSCVSFRGTWKWARAWPSVTASIVPIKAVTASTTALAFRAIDGRQQEAFMAVRGPGKDDHQHRQEDLQRQQAAEQVAGRNPRQGNQAGRGRHGQRHRRHASRNRHDQRQDHRGRDPRPRIDLGQVGWAAVNGVKDVGEHGG